MKEYVSIKQKRFADNLIAAGFTRKEVAQALQQEFKITYGHASVLVYRWYVGQEYKRTKKEKQERQKRLPFTPEVINQIQKEAELSTTEGENDKN